MSFLRAEREKFREGLHFLVFFADLVRLAVENEFAGEGPSPESLDDIDAVSVSFICIIFESVAGTGGRALPPTVFARKRSLLSGVMIDLLFLFVLGVFNGFCKPDGVLQLAFGRLLNETSREISAERQQKSLLARMTLR